ncbi:MAG: hypothetical protein COV99_09380 [Bacteroidetes bacterium CG12_big_fil_rev_8_21_14_0_65_60_17]|nr:MAG: hypothetical protein COV99_09380 [Bacteroidetes bacterium CG12_big_fil_rev_8_21_14_0_65_60_17]
MRCLSLIWLVLTCVVAGCDSHSPASSDSESFDATAESEPERRRALPPDSLAVRIVIEGCRRC